MAATAADRSVFPSRWSRSSRYPMNSKGLHFAGSPLETNCRTSSSQPWSSIAATRQLMRLYSSGRGGVRPVLTRWDPSSCARAGRLENLECQAAIFAGSVAFLRLLPVKKMRGEAGAFVFVRFRRAVVKPPVELSGIASDDFAAEFSGQEDGQR